MVDGGGAGAERLEEGAATRIDGIFAKVLEASRIPGLVAGVVRQGALVHLAGLGTADLETRAAPTGRTVFRIASVTKHVTALALLILRDEGRIALDAPLTLYVPEAQALVPPTRDSRPITLGVLLNHMAGFALDDPWADRRLSIARADLDALLAGGGLFARSPGIAFEYSNLGYALIGRAIANVTGRSAQAFVRERLLDPLGMRSTGFAFEALSPRARGYAWRDGGWVDEPPEPDGEFGPMGGLATCAEDFARWCAFVLDAWPARDDPDDGPVRRATVRELGLAHAAPRPPDVRDPDTRAVPVAWGYGYGLTSAVDPLLGRTLEHGGGLPGWGSYVCYGPETATAVFAFGNLTYAPLRRAVWEACVALRDEGLWRSAAASPDPRLLAAAQAVRAAYDAGRIESVQERLADNLLRDEPAPARDAQLARLRARHGEAGGLTLEPRHALSGRLVIHGAAGDVAADLLLAPGPEGRIQLLRFAEPHEDA